MPLIQPNNIIAIEQPLQKLFLLTPDEEKKKNLKPQLHDKTNIMLKSSDIPK